MKIRKPDNYISPDSIKDEVIVRGDYLDWYSFEKLQSSGKIAVRVLQGLEQQIIPQQKVFQNNIRMLVANHQAKQIASSVMVCAGFVLPFFYSWWFVLLIFVGGIFSMQNKANLQKNFEYALWTDAVFFRDCNELLKEPFIFAVEKDYKKEVIAEYDVQAGTL